jgi:regulator of chromosome condensation
MAPKKRASTAATKKAPAPKADTVGRVTKTTRTRRSTADSKIATAPVRSSTRRTVGNSAVPAPAANPPAKPPAKAATKGPKETATSSSSSKTGLKTSSRGRQTSKADAEQAKSKSPPPVLFISRRSRCFDATLGHRHVTNTAAPTANNEANIKRKRARSPPPSAEPAPKAGRPAKKAKVAAEPAPKPKIILTTVPTEKLRVYVTGEGSAGELGLGARASSIDVKRPRFNGLLAPDAAGVVYIACGGMHALALTHDNKILTWGVNDTGALGRPVGEGKMKDIDAESDSGSDEDSDSGLNPDEATPTAIPSSSFPEGTKFVQLAAGDSCSFAVTDDGHVYGWGQFRDANGDFGFCQNDDKTVTVTQKTPTLIKGLKNIVKVGVGADHAVALDKDGNVFAWGTGANGQLARRTMERRKYDSLNPQPVALPKKKIADIHCGTNHSFAITKTGEVYAWGLNTFAQCGISNKAVGDDGASIIKPEKIKSFLKPVKMVTGGNHHSLACTEDGDLLTFGKCQSGLGGTMKLPTDPKLIVKDEHGVPSILLKPLKINEVPGKTVFVASGGEHGIALNEEGKAYTWGFNATYQLGLGEAGDKMDNVLEATLVENNAVRDQKLIWAGAGGQYSMFASAA